MNTDPKHRIKIIGSKNEKPVIFYEEVKKPSIETSLLSWDYITEITDGKPFYLIIDVSQSDTPNAELRAFMKRRYEESKDEVLFSYVIIGKNWLYKAAFKFLAASVGIKCIDIVKNIEQAQKKIANAN